MADSHLTAAQKRRFGNREDIQPNFESNREISKKKRHVPKGPRSIQEVLEILRKSEDFGDMYEMVYESVQKQVWKNTNKLLQNDRNYVGIKTGITKNAGCCLSSQSKKKNTTLTCSTLFESLTGSSSRNKFHRKTVQRNCNDY